MVTSWCINRFNLQFAHDGLTEQRNACAQMDFDPSKTE